jgi:mono/diheme cytochrome c family protein
MACRWRCLAAALLLIGGEAVAAGDPTAGAAVAQAQCSQCHPITRSRQGIDTGIPSFGTIADRPSVTEQSVAALAQGPHMSGLNLPPRMASDVAAYVLSLRGK